MSRAKRKGTPGYVYAPSREEAQRLLDESYLQKFIAVPFDAGLGGMIAEIALLRGRLELLGAHDFEGRADRDCERCGKPDRHPFHSAAMVAREAA